MEKRKFNVLKNNFDTSVITAIVNICSNYKSNIWFVVNDNKADGKSLINLIALNLQNCNQFEIWFEGSDAYKAFDKLQQFLNEKSIIRNE